MKIKAQKFKGNGTSLWGKSDGTYSVNQMEVGYVNWVAYPEDLTRRLHASVSLFGPNTEWVQYTDSAIIASVRKNLILLVAIRAEIKRQLKAAGITQELPATLKISWSEHGMQPIGGWNFDIGGEIS